MFLIKLKLLIGGKDFDKQKTNGHIHFHYKPACDFCSQCK